MNPGSARDTMRSNNEGTITCSWFRHPDHAAVIVLVYTGTYRIGCAGNPDAEQMAAYADRILSANCCTGAIIDSRGLSYEWGDMIEILCDAGVNHDVKSVIVVGPQNEEALRSLLEEDFERFCVTTEPDAIARLKEN